MPNEINEQQDNNDSASLLDALDHIENADAGLQDGITHITGLLNTLGITADPKNVTKENIGAILEDLRAYISHLKVGDKEKALIFNCFRRPGDGNRFKVFLKNLSNEQVEVLCEGRETLAKILEDAKNSHELKLGPEAIALRNMLMCVARKYNYDLQDFIAQTAVEQWKDVINVVKGGGRNFSARVFFKKIFSPDELQTGGKRTTPKVSETERKNRKALLAIGGSIETWVNAGANLGELLNPQILGSSIQSVEEYKKFIEQPYDWRLKKQVFENLSQKIKVEILAPIEDSLSFYTTVSSWNASDSECVGDGSDYKPWADLLWSSLTVKKQRALTMDMSSFQRIVSCSIRFNLTALVSFGAPHIKKIVAGKLDNLIILIESLECPSDNVDALVIFLGECFEKRSAFLEGIKDIDRLIAFLKSMIPKETMSASVNPFDTEASVLMIVLEFFSLPSILDLFNGKPENLLLAWCGLKDAMKVNVSQEEMTRRIRELYTPNPPPPPGFRYTGPNPQKHYTFTEFLRKLFRAIVVDQVALSKCFKCIEENSGQFQGVAAAKLVHLYLGSQEFSKRFGNETYDYLRNNLTGDQYAAFELEVKIAHDTINPNRAPSRGQYVASGRYAMFSQPGVTPIPPPNGASGSVRQRVFVPPGAQATAVRPIPEESAAAAIRAHGLSAEQQRKREVAGKEPEDNRKRHEKGW